MPMARRRCWAISYLIVQCLARVDPGRGQGEDSLVLKTAFALSCCPLAPSHLFPLESGMEKGERVWITWPGMLGAELYSLCKGEEKDVPGTRVLAKGVTLRQAHLGALGKPFLPPQWPPVLSYRRSQVIEKFEALDIEKAEHMETNASAGPLPSGDTRQGRSEKRAFPRKRVSVWIGPAGGGQYLVPISSPLHQSMHLPGTYCWLSELTNCLLFACVSACPASTLLRNLVFCISLLEGMSSSLLSAVPKGVSSFVFTRAAFFLSEVCQLQTRHCLFSF